MVDNPYDPPRVGPFAAAPRTPLRRGSTYEVPPIGSGRHVDRAHLRRQEWTGRLMLLLFLGGPAIAVLGHEFGWRG